MSLLPIYIGNYLQSWVFRDDAIRYTWTESEALEYAKTCSEVIITLPPIGDIPVENAEKWEVKFVGVGYCIIECYLIMPKIIKHSYHEKQNL